MPKKPLTKIQHLFMIKILERLGIQETSKHTKSNIQQTNSQDQLKWRETQRDSTTIRNKARLELTYST